MNTTVIIILSTLLIVSIYIIRNLLIQNKKYEDIVEKQVSYLRGLSTLLRVSEQRLKEIDERGSFEADDEVGIFFTELKDTYRNIEQFLLDEKYGNSEK